MSQGQEQVKKNSSILTCWCNIWNNNACKDDCPEKMNTGDCFKYDLFMEKYKETYHIAEFEAKENKEWNFYWKKLFVILLAIYSVILLGVGIRLILSKADLSGVLLPIIIIALGGFGILFSVLKWLDVSRFQETWARHRWMKELLDLEMIRFVEKMPPYFDTISEEKRKMIFRIRVLKIQQKNIEKFTSNLESKEQRLGEGLSFPKLWGVKE